MRRHDVGAHSRGARVAHGGVRLDGRQSKMQEFSKASSRLALTAQRLAAAVYVNADMLPGLATGTRVLAGHRDELVLTERAMLPTAGTSCPISGPASGTPVRGATTTHTTLTHSRRGAARVDGRAAMRCAVGTLMVKKKSVYRHGNDGTLHVLRGVGGKHGQNGALCAHTKETRLR